MAKARLTTTSDIQTTAREVDFVTRFAKNWEHLRDIMGIMRLIRKTPGTVLKSKYAELTLQSGAVGEGEEIPYSQATVHTKDYAAINVEKFAKAVSIEAINEHGYDDAVGLTDDQFLFELQNDVVGRFYTFVGTGTLISKPHLQRHRAESEISGKQCTRASLRSWAFVTFWTPMIIWAPQISPFSLSLV